MLSPKYPAAVVAGNVEMSQAVTDTLFGALGALGSAQGTMNNLTFGDATYQYYETICSGAPAGPGFNGASGVHTHMTNSRLTDPEVLESRFPVVLEDFHIRRGSGGKGQWRAGDGTLRRIRFLRPMQAAILSGHRAVANFGMMGGSEANSAAIPSAARRAHRDPARLRPDRSRRAKRSRSSRRPEAGGGRRSRRRGRARLSRRRRMAITSGGTWPWERTNARFPAGAIRRAQGACRAVSLDLVVDRRRPCCPRDRADHFACHLDRLARIEDSAQSYRRDDDWRFIETDELARVKGEEVDGPRNCSPGTSRRSLIAMPSSPPISTEEMSSTAPNVPSVANWRKARTSVRPTSSRRSTIRRERRCAAVARRGRARRPGQ